ncbi:bromodomain-containing protein, putative [Perkinsus marinus ATCC 50983]|uniref:Bromodomain-containing protein, putative n=1 Tax=Perkinsus marinus (strain ATCC 50983 / TXsc) TaxID=423536 RepID=C5KPA0_PERM5|nr:bromodomain-containing protein, putative [Perkinsus marinus ATCC 50983]EER13707.1 bromodomain-containing protein, putative [Perkinsus marinus ATCC 50983]|eukprot:XP_002781912.1 bromodomain-containing protein, putative [Perkinsus marinus ATCC 50983]
MAWRDECRKVRARVEKADRGYFFVKPVVECELPDDVKRRYKMAISDPMDLRTVGEKLDGDALYSPEGFEKDMNLMFTNCFVFNTPGEYAHTEGKRLKKLFDSAWKSAKERINKGAARTPAGRSGKKTGGRKVNETGNGRDGKWWRKSVFCDDDMVTICVGES